MVHFGPHKVVYISLKASSIKKCALLLDVLKFENVNKRLFQRLELALESDWLPKILEAPNCKWSPNQTQQRLVLTQFSWTTFC